MEGTFRFRQQHASPDRDPEHFPNLIPHPPSESDTVGEPGSFHTMLLN